MLIGGLPDTASMYRYGQWGVDRELAAVQVELLHALIGAVQNLQRLTAGKHSKKVAPLRIPRPKSEPSSPEPKKSTAQRWLDFARQLRG